MQAISIKVISIPKVLLIFALLGVGDKKYWMKKNDKSCFFTKKAE